MSVYMWMSLLEVGILGVFFPRLGFFLLALLAALKSYALSQGVMQ
jgi:hypothetical protein